MEPTTVAKPLALMSALMSFMLASSSHPSINRSIGSTSVCATGTCCVQAGSICNDGSSDEKFNYYYLASGSCPHS